MSSKNIKIYVIHHKDYWKLESKIFTPVQVGKSYSNLELQMISDNTGDNIAHKNKNYCELTAMYWVWKNIQNLDYVGFCHYRRYLNLNPDISTNLHIINISDTNPATLNKYGLNDDDKIADLVKQYDIIISKKEDFNDLTIEFQYKRWHIPEDWDLMISVILEKYPDYSDNISKTFQRNKMSAFNMFIMKYDIFIDYMEWLFDILFEIEKRITISEKPYQARVFGFMTERLLNLYISKIQETKNLQIKEVETLYLEITN